MPWHYVRREVAVAPQTSSVGATEERRRQTSEHRVAGTTKLQTRSSVLNVYPRVGNQDTAAGHPDVSGAFADCRARTNGRVVRAGGGLGCSAARNGTQTLTATEPPVSGCGAEAPALRADGDTFSDPVRALVWLPSCPPVYFLKRSRWCHGSDHRRARRVGVGFGEGQDPVFTGVTPA